MSDVIEITSYQYYVFSSRQHDEAQAVMQLTGASGLVGYVYFDSTDLPLPPAEKLASGVYALRYRMGALPIILDMLRNEKPVYLMYVDGLNSRLATLAEPVGEGERGGRGG